MVLKYFLFSPLLGEDEPILTNIFQRGWFNHQLVYYCNFQRDIVVWFPQVTHPNLHHPSFTPRCVRNYRGQCAPGHQTCYALGMAPPWNVSANFALKNRPEMHPKKRKWRYSKRDLLVYRRVPIIRHEMMIMMMLDIRFEFAEISHIMYNCTRLLPTRYMGMKTPLNLD